MSNECADFTTEEIQLYLDELAKLIKDDSYTIALNGNRQENIDFMEDYRITSEKSKEILLSITPYDFCYAVNNRNPNFSHEKLYIFCKEFPLDNWGDTEIVDIYIKTNQTHTVKGGRNAIIISFHKRNKPISFYFKS